MIPVSVAIEIVTGEVEPLAGESVPLAATVGRILAEDIIADSDMPPFNRSQMDGYAVRADDTANAPVMLKIVGESAAGRGWHNMLEAGEAICIMTGASVPAGADAVQKVELTAEHAGAVEIRESVKTGRNIVNRGSETRCGDKVISSGTQVTQNMIATLAAFGYASVKVAKRPMVTIMSTGSELVEVHQTPGIDQIRNSNSAMLDALARGCGCETAIAPIEGDDLTILTAAISDSLNGSDILLITGGVSVGKYDLTKLALAEIGAEIFFEKVSMKPGKPVVFAKYGKTPIFGLPGNPVSAAVTFFMFARMAALQMQDARETTLRRGHAVLVADVKAAQGRDTYLPAKLDTDAAGRLLATPTRWQGSSDFIGLANADALIFIPKGERRETGSVAEILFL